MCVSIRFFWLLQLCTTQFQDMEVSISISPVIMFFSAKCAEEKWSYQSFVLTGCQLFNYMLWSSKGSSQKYTKYPKKRTTCDQLLTVFACETTYDKVAIVTSTESSQWNEDSELMDLSFALQCLEAEIIRPFCFPWPMLSFNQLHSQFPVESSEAILSSFLVKSSEAIC